MSAGTRLEPIWQAGAALAPTAVPQHAGAVIIGGGLTGVSLLYWLSRAGMDAVLFERRHLAAGASGRNAGFVLMGITANYALAVETHGRERARAIWAFTAENHAALREALANRSVGYARRGSWTLAITPPEAIALQDSAALLREDGLPGEWRSPLDGSLRRFPGGLRNPDDGEVDPVLVVRALAGQAGSASIHEGITVTGLEASAGGARVHCGSSETKADLVILATNAYTSQLAPDIPIAPVRGQMLATQRTSMAVAARPVYAHWGFQYWRQPPTGEVLVGGYRDRALDDELGFDERPTPRVQAYLDAHLGQLGVQARVTHRWAGTMGFTPDALPLVGPVPDRPNLYICGGYSGHGMGFAVHAARRLVDLLRSGTPLPSWLRADRFAARSLRST